MMRNRIVYRLGVVVSTAALVTACLPSAGPALVDVVAAKDDVVAGNLMIEDGCVMLSERGHRILTLGWPTQVTTWDAENRSLEFAGSSARTLHDGDAVTLTGELVPNPDQVVWVAPPGRSCQGEAVMLVADVTEVVVSSGPVDVEITGPEQPIGGGLGAGTGVDQSVECPPSVDEAETEWFGPGGLTMQGAVAEAFGDLGVGWVGEPFEMKSTDEWSSWGLRDTAGRLVAVVTVAASYGGWDPSHARYCELDQPTPPAEPFTLYVSNQSFEDANVGITIIIDSEVVVDQDFAVDGQHNWIEFTPDTEPGDHTLTATSSTGAEFAVDFTLLEDEPRWAVLDYWYYPGEEPRHFTFQISDEPLVFD